MSSLISPSTDSLASLLGDKGGAFSLKELMQAQQEQRNRVASPADETRFESSKKGLNAVSQMQSYEASYSYSETMSLTLKTQEGDTVKVDFRQLYAEYQAHKTEMYAENSPNGVRYFESTEQMENTHFEEQFGFSVEGDINDDELKAIFSVFEQVDELANNFFDGNIEKALQQAVEMEIDFSQLQSVDLNLQQTETYSETYQQAATYENFEQTALPAEPQEFIKPSIADLPPYLQQLQGLLNELDKQFEDSQGVLNEFIASVTMAKFPDQGKDPTWLDRIKSFHEQLFSEAGAVALKDVVEPTVKLAE